ncbi:MAG: hypothetical protein ABII74_06075 [Elusimicrobiota bacterium]
MKKSHLVGLVGGLAFILVLAAIYWLSTRGPKDVPTPPTPSLLEETEPGAEGKGAELEGGDEKASKEKPKKIDDKNAKNLAEVQKLIDRNASLQKINNVNQSNPPDVQRVLKTIDEINRINQLNKVNRKAE